MIELRECCANCSRNLCLYERHSSWVVSCYHGCYDPGADDSAVAELLSGWGDTPEDAMTDYVNSREALDLDPLYVPSELASFIVPPPPEGFVISPDPSEPARLFFESLSSAERHPELGPIYYGPMLAQKAANDS